MLDIKAVRQDPDAVAEALATRGHRFDADTFRALDARRKQADVDNQNLLAAIRGEPDAKPETTGHDNLETVKLVFGCYESAAKGAAVTVS